MPHSRKGELFTEVVLEIFKLSGFLAAAGDQLASEFGLSSARWKVLGTLDMAELPPTISQISRTMGLTRQAVQRIANAMEQDGLLTYQKNPQHKRASHVTMTKKGRTIYTLISKKQAPWANQTSEELDSAELETSLTALRKITEILQR